MIQPAPPPNDGDQAADAADGATGVTAEVTGEATDGALRPTGDLDPSGRDVDDERRRGYEPL